MVGVIVRLEKEAFKVLQKRNNRAVALDMNQVSLTCFICISIFLKQNSISARDIVKVVDGPHTVCVFIRVCVCTCVFIRVCIRTCVCLYVSVFRIRLLHVFYFRVNKERSSMCIEDQCLYSHVIW